MDRFISLCETCVSAGIRAYIGLLSYGELQRSRLLLRDILTLSSAFSRGPSVGRNSPFVATRCIIAHSVAQSMLSSLLVLRVTEYWARIPALGVLLEASSRLGQLASANRTDMSAKLDRERGDDDDTGTLPGGRRSRTLPDAPGDCAASRTAAVSPASV
jgi:hypothetical protein